jgi:HlyD family secretion protein
MTDATAVTEELKKALAAEEGIGRWIRRLGAAAAGGLVLAGVIVWGLLQRPPPPARFVTATVTTGDVVEKVQATGAVQPVLQVTIGAQVNGRLTNVYVDFNSHVKKGELLAEIDPSIAASGVSVQQSNLSAQRAQLEQAKAAAASNEAQKETARINYERTQRLFEQNLASRADLDTVKGNYDGARAMYEAAMATVRSAQATIAAQAAQLRQSTANLGYTKIFSPVDGVVVTRAMNVGDTVVASFQSPVLFVVAQDLRKMRVLADIDEADVGKIEEGMIADCVVDAFPGEVFHGRVSQIRFSPNNVSGVVTYPGVVEVDNPDEKLRPGMTATITVHSHEAHDVPRIPNAALRYRPGSGGDGGAAPAPAEAPLAKGQGRVWIVTSDRPGDERNEMRVVSIGITDGISTEVKDPALPLGAKVVTDETDVGDQSKKRRYF